MKERPKGLPPMPPLLSCRLRILRDWRRGDNLIRWRNEEEERGAVGEDEEDAEQTEGMVCVLVGGERVADAATRALCALSGTDASEESSATGGKGAGVADLADRAIAGLEAALVGPSGRSGARHP